MDNRIRKTAIKFYKSLHGKPESARIIAALKKVGFEVVFFNTSDGDAIIKSYRLQELAASRDAFTCSGKSKQFVFINNNLSAIEKRNALLHETGHIMLGHVGSGEVCLLDNRVNEAEADAFMLEVLCPTRTYHLPLALIIGVLVCALAFNLPGKQSSDLASVSIPQISEEIVYITSTGSKYHTEGCIHTKDKNCAEIIRQQADKILSPCAICNP